MLVGQRFGRLEILSSIPKVVTEGVAKKKRRAWQCRCDCGAEVYVRGSNLTTGHVRSCGCLGKEGMKPKYGKACIENDPSLKRTYTSWAQMKNRCYNSKSSKYEYWGGRGIKVCDRWKDSFEFFLADMGLRPPGTSLGRVDNDRDYSPGNCQWETIEQQSVNKRITVMIGDEKLIDICNKLGLDRTRVYQRLKMGWSIEEAISKPIKRYKKS